MPRLPAFDPRKQINYSPHVVILGAGASRAAFPSGDAKTKPLPLLVDLPDCLGLRAAITNAGFPANADFESIYGDLATTGRNPSLKAEIESKVRGYFESLEMPDEPTLYDYLLLGLRETDLVATFNWDPFLARAFARNRDAAAMPKLAFLHGNVEVGVCLKDSVKGFRGDTCRKCGQPFKVTTLLYPVRKKNYSEDPFIANEWAVLKESLGRAYMVTIFGYSAPTTDAAAVELMSKTWGKNPTFELCHGQGFAAPAGMAKYPRVPYLVVNTVMRSAEEGFPGFFELFFRLYVHDVHFAECPLAREPVSTI